MRIIASFFKMLLFLLVIASGMDELTKASSQYSDAHLDIEICESEQKEREDKVREQEKDEEEQVLLHSAADVAKNLYSGNIIVHPRLYLYGLEQSLLRPPTKN